MTAVLYTTHCPRCNVLEKKLQQAGIEYTTSEDVQHMISLGYRTAPVLVIDEYKDMDFKDACIWLKGYEERKNKEEACDLCKLI